MKEQKELHRNLGTANSFSHQQEADEVAAGLRALLQQGDLLEEELNKEKQRQLDVEKEVNEVFLDTGSLPAGAFFKGLSSVRVCS